MTLLFLLVLLALLGSAGGQFPVTSPTYMELSSYAVADLNYTIVTQADPVLVARHHPDLYLLPTSFYVLTPPSPGTFTQNVLFDPCRDQPFSCCQDTFGTPEFELVAGEPSSAAYGARQYLYADGSPTPLNARRRPQDQLVVDATCTGLYQPPGRVDCVASRVARQPWPSAPVCWNWNASISAGVACRSPLDGSALPSCLELGYTQNAYIADCGGPYAGDPHCGTYLEVHRPGREDKLAEVRLPGTAPSGYRMTVVSTTYKRDPAKALCYDPSKGGRYEVWWVLRARDKFSVLKRMPFAVVSPLCDWDAHSARYLEYATLATAQRLTGVDYFNPAKRLFTQPSLNGTPAAPGLGMGSTFVLLPPSNATPPRFDAAQGVLVYP
jgi:hypothetical protein